MDNLNYTKGRVGDSEATKSRVKDSANDLVNEGKKYANELYEEGLAKVDDVETMVQEYSDKLVQKIHTNPLSSVLVAMGVGILLSSILRKK